MNQRDEGDEPIIDPALLGEMLEAITPIPPPAHLRAKVLSRVREEQAKESFATLRNGIGWRVLIPGVEFKMLCVDKHAGTKSFLLRAEAGMRLPPHAHQGMEECLVLEGQFSMGDLTLQAGDFHLAHNGTSHDEAYTETGVVVYLRSSINDYPGIEL